MKVGIVGLGLLGSSLAASLHRVSDRYKIFGFTGRESTKIDAEMSGYFIDVFNYSDINRELENLDFLFLCTPIEVIKENIREISKSSPLTSKLIVTDIGSTKVQISELANELFENREDITFIGGHPMTGSEFSGFTANDATIFENTIYLLTPTEKTNSLDLEKLIQIIKLIGANPTIIDPYQHDKVAALISHFPQLIATLMTDMVANDCNMQEAKKLAAGGFRDMTRIASSGYTMWKDIFKTNRDVIVSVIDTFIDKLEKVKSELGEDTLFPVFKNAGDFRDEIPKDMRGFLSAIWELVVQVPDEPGVLLKITNVLYENGINIKDFSVIKIRERISGSIKLGFETIDDRDFAQKLIENEGFKATKRD